MQIDNSSNNKRIAKNTMLLYVRMLFLMLISLYTSRVILNALGVEDYGIYNVVGGVVTMFSVLSGSLSAAVSRFLTFELGKGEIERLEKVFSSSVTIQAVIAFVVIVLAETIGLWFLNTKMVIPEDRLEAANWCFQFSVITFAINLVSVPFNASIVSHEKMSAFAYISIIEGVGKLIIAWCIVINPIDRLVFFAGMVAVLAWIICYVYASYCTKHFSECVCRFIYDHDLLKQMFAFAGWNFIGASSAVLRDQGGNIILNLFFGPTVNAARAIAVKISIVVSSFVQNFMMALNPQITKSYANGDKEYMKALILQGAKFSYYILLLLCIPILLNTSFILVRWLKLVPDHAVLFVQLSLLFVMCESISHPLITAMLATGNIKYYQIVVGGLQMLNLPISYILLRYGAAPEVVIVVAVVLGQFCLAARLLMLKRMIGLSTILYIKSVYINVLIVSFLSYLLSLGIRCLAEESVITFLLTSLCSVLVTACIEFFVGCSAPERKLAYSFLRKYIYFIK